MNLIPVEAVPQRNYHHLQDLINEFADGEAEVVRVHLGKDEYKTVTSARSCLGVAAKRSKRNVKVWLRGNQIFLSKVVTA